MIRFLLIMIACGFAFSSSCGQTDSTNLPRTRLKLGFYANAIAVQGDFSSLNSAISAQGYPVIQDTYSGGTFGYSIRNPKKSSYSTIGFSFMATNPSPLYDNRIKDARVRMMEFYNGNCFDLVSHPKWLVYPYFGFGFGWTYLTLYDNLNTQTSFAASISNLSNPTSKYFSDFYVFANVGSGFERKFRIGVYDFYAGLTGGYRLSTNANFHEYYQSYSDAPPVRLSGLEWKFVLRFEIFRKPRNKYSDAIK